VSVAEPIILSWSGGKDSSVALQALRMDSRFDVVGLLTSVTRGYDRISIHGVRRELLEAQARSIGLPLYEVTLEPQSSNDAYEAAFRAAALSARAKIPQLERIAFGDLFLEDVRAYREKLLASVGLKGHYPLWLRDTAALAREFVDAGFRARLVCVDTTQLDADFAGREFDHALLGDLPSAVDPCGEKGEFHTFVFDGPIMTAPVEIECGERVTREGRFEYCDLILRGNPG
jgi:uncharacterized protein (TIGR00290 family)